MKEYRVTYSSRADDQLVSIYRYIAAEASPETAQRFFYAGRDFEALLREEQS